MSTNRILIVYKKNYHSNCNSPKIKNFTICIFIFKKGNDPNFDPFFLCSEPKPKNLKILCAPFILSIPQKTKNVHLEMMPFRKNIVFEFQKIVSHCL